MGEHGVDVDPVDDRVQVDVLDQRVEVEPGQQAVDVGLRQHGIEIDPVDDAVEVETVDHLLHIDPFDNALDVDALGDRLDVDPLHHPVDVDGVDDHRGDLVGHRLQDARSRRLPGRPAPHAGAVDRHVGFALAGSSWPFLHSVRAPASPRPGVRYSTRPHLTWPGTDGNEID